MKYTKPESLQAKIKRNNYIMIATALIAMALVSVLSAVIFRNGIHTGDRIFGILIQFLLSFSIVAFVVYRMNRKLSRQIEQMVEEPVRMLLDASSRVENGNFEELIDYSGEVEFEKLCTAFNQMQIGLKEGQEKSEAYEKARIAMVAGISHDLRTPLTSIKGYIGGIRDGIANTEEKQKFYLDIAYKKAQEMDVMLSRLLYFSKLETGSLPNEQTHVDLYEVLDNYVEEMETELQMRNAKLSFSKKEDKCPVYVDRAQMLRVFDNLISNSLKYAGISPIELSITCEIKEKNAVVRFADNGKGVSEDKLPYIFELFYRADAARTSKTAEGSGLGLYIVKYIVESQKGSVKAYNDHGFVVEITLPLEEDA